jgi:inner membrane protein
MIPNEVTPLWSIALSSDAAPDEHAAYLVHREVGPDSRARMWEMLTGS